MTKTLILDSDPEMMRSYIFGDSRERKGKKEEITWQGKYHVCGWNEEQRKKEGKHLLKENVFFCGGEEKQRRKGSKIFVDQKHF